MDRALLIAKLDGAILLMDDLILRMRKAVAHPQPISLHPMELAQTHDQAFGALREADGQVPGLLPADAPKWQLCSWERVQFPPDDALITEFVQNVVVLRMALATLRSLG